MIFVWGLLMFVILSTVACVDYGFGAHGTEAPRTGDGAEARDDPSEDDGSTDDTGETDGACPVPVPDHVDLTEVVWAEPGVHFYVPAPSWGFAAAHAHRQLQGLSAEGLGLELRPSYFFATMLKESFMGCSDATGPDPLHPQHAFARQAAADWDGCMQLEETTAWTELCRLFPGDIDCDAVAHQDAISSLDQATTGYANVETSMFAAAWYGTFAYAMLTTHGASDPDTWFAAASDSQAQLKTIALVYNRGAWSGEVTSVIEGCMGGPIEDCVTAGSVAWDYVTAVASYAADLEEGLAAGSCYDAAVTADDVLLYLDALPVLFPDHPWQDIEGAALEAFEAAAPSGEAGFQQVADPVLDAVEASWAVSLACPQEELSAWYGVSCPS